MITVDDINPALPTFLILGIAGFISASVVWEFQKVLVYFLQDPGPIDGSLTSETPMVEAIFGESYGLGFRVLLLPRVPKPVGSQIYPTL